MGTRYFGNNSKSWTMFRVSMNACAGLGRAYRGFSQAYLFAGGSFVLMHDNVSATPRIYFLSLLSSVFCATLHPSSPFFSF